MAQVSLADSIALPAGRKEERGQATSLSCLFCFVLFFERLSSGYLLQIRLSKGSWLSGEVGAQAGWG